MESIYDHNPTKTEIDALTYGVPKERYLNKENTDLLIAHIAILYADRNDTSKSKLYWDKVPHLREKWLLGLDCISIPQD